LGGCSCTPGRLYVLRGYWRSLWFLYSHVVCSQPTYLASPVTFTRCCLDQICNSTHSLGPIQHVNSLKASPWAAIRECLVRSGHCFLFCRSNLPFWENKLATTTQFPELPADLFSTRIYKKLALSVDHRFLQCMALRGKNKQPHTSLDHSNMSSYLSPLDCNVCFAAKKEKVQRYPYARARHR
jgi:hypothetical protein